MLEDEEEYYEHINYREMLKLQPDDFFLHLPLQLPFLKWFFELRLQFLLLMNMEPNYFGLRHRFDPIAQWFSDWVYINHYQFDYMGEKKWKPSLTDRVRYQWLMRQGYQKQQKNYLEVLSRQKEKKVTVQERKFLKKYGECRFWSYFDYARDDELAFFRLGIDADEQLANEDKPLFPNIAYSYKDDPRLAYWIANSMQTEHIPPYQSQWNKRKARKLITKKWKKGEKVTYTDMRPMFNPDTTKIHDIEFIFHTLVERVNEPTNAWEDELLDKIYPLYRMEISQLAQMMQFPELKDMQISHPRKALNPLYIAYKQRWFNKNPVKEFEKIFHGVTQEEYQEIVNEQYKHFDKIKRPKSQKKIDKSEIKKLNDLFEKISKLK